MEMNHYLINKNRTSYGCNVTKDKILKKNIIYIFFYDISTTNTNSIYTLLLFYTKSSPGSVLLLGGILGIRQSQSKI